MTMSMSEHKAFLKIERDALADCVMRLKDALVQKEGPFAGQKEWRALNWQLWDVRCYLHYTAEVFRQDAHFGKCGPAETLLEVRLRLERLGLMLTSYSQSLFGSGRELLEEMRNCVWAAASIQPSSVLEKRLMGASQQDSAGCEGSGRNDESDKRDEAREE